MNSVEKTPDMCVKKKNTGINRDKARKQTPITMDIWIDR